MGKRYFISIDVTEGSVHDDLIEMQEKLAGYGDTKRTSPTQFHVTLNFIGEMNKDEAKMVYSRLQDVSHEPFTMKVQGLGAFPELEYINVVWAGVNSNTDSLARDVRKVLPERLRDEKDFHGHITLLRVKTIDRHEKEMLQDKIQNNEETPFGSIHVDSFTLKKSIVKPSGPDHSTVQEFDLG